MDKSILELLQMKTVEPDATKVALEPLDVFGEKSKDADDILSGALGLTQEEIFDIASSVTPMGSIKAGKGAISLLKALLGRMQSQRKFPIGYNKPSPIIPPQREEPINVLNALSDLYVKPKGIRQVGKFNRQLQRKNYK